MPAFAPHGDLHSAVRALESSQARAFSPNLCGLPCKADGHASQTKGRGAILPSTALTHPLGETSPGRLMHVGTLHSPPDHPLLQKSPDFSLVLGGPLYQLWRRSHLAGDACSW